MEAVPELEALSKLRQDDANPSEEELSIAIYELIQHALQCGPLAGGKPGYFKRCGSQVATMVHAFLVEIVAHGDEAMAMGMTEKQAKAIEKFKANALKASENAKPPSASVQKKQELIELNYIQKLMRISLV